MPTDNEIDIESLLFTQGLIAHLMVEPQLVPKGLMYLKMLQFRIDTRAMSVVAPDLIPARLVTPSSSTEERRS